MTGKRANWLFLTMILTHIAVSLFLSFFGGYIRISTIASFFLGEAVLVGPALLFLLFSRTASQPVPNGAAAAPGGFVSVPQPVRPTAFRRIKISSLLMIALSTVLLMPFVTVLNTLTLFFTDNAVAAMEGNILSLPFPVMLFMIGIFGPFCEEFVFRGMIYGSYGSGLLPILLSAFLFGLMHMNFNQAVYAFAIGVFLAILVEAAGSLWASVFCHMFFNSYEVVMMYLSKAVLGSKYMEAVSEAAELTSAQLQAVLAVYLLIAAVTTPIALCCVAWIAKNEGRQEAVLALFRRQSSRAAGQGPSMGGYQGALQPEPSMSGQQEPQESLITVPLIVAAVLCLGFMSLEWFLL